MQRGSPEKKISAQAVSEKKKNSCKLKIPHLPPPPSPLQHFSNGPSLRGIYSYLFFYKINKGDLPLMYSCVFCCEFIDFVGFFFGCYCLTPVTLFILRCKGSTEKQPVVRTLYICLLEGGLRTENPSTRGNLIIIYHRYTAVNV